MNLRPLRDEVIVRREKYDEHTDSNVIAIPDTGRVSIFARVVAVGPKVTDIKPDDRIVLQGWSGKVIKCEGGDLLSLPEDQIPVVVDG